VNRLKEENTITVTVKKNCSCRYDRTHGI